MRKRVIKGDGGEKHRRLVGLGIPLVGGVLLWMLWPFPLHVMMLTQAGWNLEGLSGRSFLLIGAMMLLCGIGAAFYARGVALLVVPLALLLGWLLVSTFFSGELLSYFFTVQPLKYLSPVLLEAEIGAIIGLGVLKGIPLVQRTMARVQQQVKAELHTAPTQIFPSSAEASASQARPQPSNGTASTQPEQQQRAGESQDDIARIVAEMQQAYAQAAKPNEPNDGNPNRR